MVSDNEIIELVANEQTIYRGFQLLVDSYKESIYWHIRRLAVSHEDAEDIMQESFIKIYRYIHSFERRSSLKTWIYRIVTNEVIRHNSKRNLTMDSYDQTSRLVEMFSADPQVDFTSAEAQLHLAILSLPEKQRIIYNLRNFDGLTYEQIAQITGSTILSLRTNYYYANQKVRKYILNNMK